MRHERHYCNGFKTTAPQAPGTSVIGGTTIGVAHVIMEPMAVRAFPCRPQKIYHPDEQLRNLEEMEL